MKSVFFRLIVLGFLVQFPSLSFAWGGKGHEIVAEVAFHYLDDSTKARVLRDLGKQTIEEAANWMDEMRSNDYYDFMKPWHYIDFPKGTKYEPSVKDRNIIIILNSAIHELDNRSSLKQKNVKQDLDYLFHLIGDLHQPLHTGYQEDKGGNTIQVSFIHKSYSTNLHKVWDFEIIDSKQITLDSVIAQHSKFSEEQISTIQKSKIADWLNDSRNLLDTVYNFENHFLDQAYVDRNAEVVKNQLLIAGLRLAAVLKEAYKDYTN